jgi:hypothetical protein
MPLGVAENRADAFSQDDKYQVLPEEARRFVGSQPCPGTRQRVGL